MAKHKRKRNAHAREERFGGGQEHRPAEKPIRRPTWEEDEELLEEAAAYEIDDGEE